MTDGEDCGGCVVDGRPGAQRVAVGEQLRGLPVVAEPLGAAGAFEDSDLRVGRSGFADDPEDGCGPRERDPPELDELRDDPARVGLDARLARA